MDGSVWHSVSNSGALPPAEVLAFADNVTFINTVTIYNNSSMTIGLFPGQYQPNGTPKIVVPPNQTQTLPIELTKFVAVQYYGGNTRNGFVYIHYTDKLLSSSASSNDAAEQSIFYGISATGTQTVKAFGTNTIIPVGNALTIDDYPSQRRFSNAIKIARFQFSSNMPGDYIVSFGASNVAGGAQQSDNLWAPLLELSGGIDEEYPTPLPIYITGNNIGVTDTTGQTVQCNIVITPDSGQTADQNFNMTWALALFLT